jgi:hypothetical protein
VFSERETGEMVAASGVDGRQDAKGGQRGVLAGRSEHKRGAGKKGGRG